MILSSKEKRRLAQQAHKLKPVIMIGNKGLTTAVQEEINLALAAHELLKIKINDHDRQQINTMVPDMCNSNHAHHIQTIGHVVTLWRPPND